MRDIKFRGFCKRKKRWIYGDLSQLNNFNQPSIVEGIYHVDGAEYNMNESEVEEESIGQYTGLEDKNSKEIYEGDIVRFTWHSVLCSSEKPIDRRYEVVYIDGGFRQADTYGAIGNWYKWDEVEIIGNIYENPELLEEK